MANILVKGVDSGLLREVNYAAKGVGLTQTQWIIRLLLETVNGDVGRGSKGQQEAVASEQRVQRKTRGKVGPAKEAVSGVSEESADGGSRYGRKSPGWCKIHGKMMKDFGTKWICDGPPSHTEAK